jgi:hypothetical protein
MKLKKNLVLFADKPRLTRPRFPFAVRPVLQSSGRPKTMNSCSGGTSLCSKVPQSIQYSATLCFSLEGAPRCSGRIIKSAFSSTLLGDLFAEL